MRPICEQPQYNMLVRDRFENEYAPLFENYKMGTTIWSPLAGGFLTGKHMNEIQKDSRTSNPIYKSFFYDPFMDDKHKDKTIKQMKAIEPIAKAMNISMAQLAIGWAIKNKDVSTAIIGSSSIKQLDDNIVALKTAKLITPEIEAKIELALENKPVRTMDWKSFKTLPARR